MRRGVVMATPGNEDALSRGQALDGAETGTLEGSILKAKRKPGTDETRTSNSQSVLNLVNCILGAGVLGYPFCFRSCGLLLGSLLMVVSLVATRFSYDLLLYCSQISNKKTYEELAEQAIGKAGRQIVELCTAALNLGCIVAYLNILADVLSAVAGTIIPPGAEPSRNAYITGVSIFGALPVALVVRDHATIATFSMASVGFVILFAIVLVIFALGPVPVAASAAGSLALWRPEGLLVAFPVIVYSFTAHPYYLGIFNNMHVSTFARMTKVTDLLAQTARRLYI
ncbi:putative sodium-coupled neutral amino acid transporter 10 [Tetrabaena socialis]|uniref:Putative sodium-coupled neutral amino acid transporter 10 n=1 Tax=Tetrabaena socialis TaxID=47790 RepID=A0A2J8A9L4_9CHLO|nr:putative sodium-coupled neutral amino acid transporter 10 [Tetrabaena socialis]|eukprot:PNH09218.1 putative sodium-coupled neutral amino acid transporter 10 [Tetrabaena socialis]